MRIAVPLVDEALSAHFGHCRQFALVDVDLDQRKILSTQRVDAPPHQPGLLPRWLAEQGAGVIIAGGMGSRAQGLFAGQGIEVIVGAPTATAEAVVARYLDGSLKTGVNLCDH